MDREEVARRLEEIRKEVRERLADQKLRPLDDGVREEVPFQLEPRIGLRVSGDPALTTTTELEAANRSVDPSQPLPSQASGVGPLINLVRRLTHPVVKLFAGGQLARQRDFNAHTVRHLNEFGQRLEERVRNLEEALEVWSENPSGVEARLRGTLEQYDAALRQRHAMLFSALEEEVLVAHTAAQRLQKLEELVVERSQAVDERFDEKDRVFTAQATEAQRTQHELSTSVADVEKELDRMAGQIGEFMAMRTLLKKALDSATAPAAAPTAATPETPSVAEPAEWSELSEQLFDEDYRAFQARFRGDPEIIAERMRAHVARFEGVGGVVADLGCGRGEFLDLLREAGVESVGVEINAADVAECRERGHEATVADLFDWLEQQTDDSLGGIFLAQVIEHLPPAAWQRLVELAAAKLTVGGRLVVETINPESLYAMARAYVLDPTHIRPVHPELLAFLARRAGFHPVQVDYQAPVPEDERPAGLPLLDEAAAAELSAETRVLAESLRRVDRLCCAPQEYTMCAVRPGDGGSS